MRNFQARNNMRAMTKGDLGFFYHTGDEKRVVGIVKVVKEAHPESTDPTGQWECVDVAAVAALPRPVTLAEIKAEPEAQVHGAGEEFAPVGAAGDARRSGARCAPWAASPMPRSLSAGRRPGVKSTERLEPGRGTP